MQDRGTQDKRRNTIKDAINLCVDGRQKSIGIIFGLLGQTPRREWNSCYCKFVQRKDTQAVWHSEACTQHGNQKKDWRLSGGSIAQHIPGQ